MSREPLESDEALVEKVRNAVEGDIRSFETLVDRHRNGIVSNCRYLARSTGDAEDLAQEVFVKAFFGLVRFQGRSSFRTWLQRIKVNHCLNFIKKREARQELDIEDPSVAVSEELSVQPAVEKTVQVADDRSQINRILDSMSDKLRIPLIMRDMDEMSYQDIAETLGIGLSAVKMRIKRARGTFRDLARQERPHQADGSPER